MQSYLKAEGGGRQRDARTHDALVGLLYRQSYAVLFANLVIPAPVAYVLWGAVPDALLLGWVALIFALTLVRIGLSRRYFTAGTATLDTPAWTRSFTVLSWLSSALWGALGWFGFLPDAPHLLAFVCIVFTGMSCGAVPSLSAYPPAYAGSLVAMLAPFMLRCLLAGEAIYHVYLAFALCLIGANLYYSRITYRTLRESVRLRFENLALIGDLEQERDKAQAADRAKSRFLAAASHDLRQPIHALSLFVAALGAMAQRGDLRADEARGIADRLRAVVGNVSGLLNGLLDISRLDAGVVAVSREPVSLARLFDDLRHQYAAQAQERGLDWQVVGSRVWVDSDPVLLKRILDNLLSNAFRYTRHGRVLLGVRRRAGQVEIQVIDTGLGIAAEQQAVVFDEFVQLHTSGHDRDREQGLGLGLAIVRRTADLLGHEVKLHSRAGRGTRFSLRVPLAVPTVPAKPMPAASATRTALGIVVVDDERDVLDAVGRLLQVWGHRVYAGRSAQEARDVHAAALRTGQAPVHLIIADHHLGDGHNGVEAIGILQRHLGAAVPAIILTGDTSPQGLKDIAISGHRLLHKPVDSDDLEAAIDAASG
ncbi:ATP-binding protein [Lysobacter cavernae]|uniref:histidine kinase n=1 Tax=Lysobacter cavernae TaxID=1685901 RepID=A0ABV7RRB7_9GAMM